MKKTAGVILEKKQLTNVVARVGLVIRYFRFNAEVYIKMGRFKKWLSGFLQLQASLMMMEP